MIISIFLATLLGTSAHAKKIDPESQKFMEAMGKISCETVIAGVRQKLEIRSGCKGTALDEAQDTFLKINGHKIAVFFYRDRSLGIVIDDSTSTAYNVDSLHPNLLLFHSLRDGTEVKCFSKSGSLAGTRHRAEFPCKK